MGRWDRFHEARAITAEAIEFMKAKGLAGNVLVDFNWAEYFMWHAPESKVFFDGRYDSVYSLAIVARHAAPRTTTGYGRARGNLDRHANYVVPRSSPAPPDSARTG